MLLVCHVAYSNKLLMVKKDSGVDFWWLVGLFCIRGCNTGEAKKTLTVCSLIFLFFFCRFPP